MSTVIIEDENLTARRLEGMLKKYDPAIQVNALLPSVEETVKWLGEHPAPDLVFMDIHLEDDLAFRIFERTNLQAPVIFTTAYDEYMIQAFKVNSIDYLLKPVNYDELAQALEKYKSLKKQYAQPDLDALLQYFGHKNEPVFKERFMITVGTKIRSIETHDVAYFYSEDKITFMVTRDGQHLPIDFSLEKLVSVLNPKTFFRISRQYLVSFSAIRAAHAYFKGKLKLDLSPRPKSEALVSADRVTEFKEWMGR